MSEGHAYNPDCGCPGCQFLWAAEVAYSQIGPPLKIGAFTPALGDYAEDPRYPGFFRTWAGGGWYPRFLLGEPVCVCAAPERHSSYGCEVDDSTLPEPVAIDQAEAMRRRNRKPLQDA